MVVVTVLLAVLAVGALVAAVLGFSRARRAEAEVAAGSKRVGDLVQRVADLESAAAGRQADLDAATRDLASAQQAATAAEQERETIRQDADDQRTRAAAAELERAELATRVATLESEIMTATEAKVAADVRADALAVAADAGDGVSVGQVAASPEALWRLELARSERLWRNSVAVVPDEPSPITTADDVLRAALDIELAAAREESGVEVELEIDLPQRLGAPEALAVLRSTQELLPVAVRAGHATTLWVAAAGQDIIVEVSSLDDDGTPIEVAVPDLPPGRLVAQAGGIRLVGFLGDAHS